MHYQFQQYNPNRTPSWRFDRLTQLLSSDPIKHPSPKSDDQDTRDAFKFLRLLHAAKTEEAQLQLFPKNPGLYYAYLIYQDEDRTTRRYIETRLLAQQTDPEVANAVSTLPSTITWYESLFFNVRDRIKNRDWIMRQILGPAIDRMLDDRAVELVEKFYAYFRGPYMYELLSDGFGNQQIITPEDETNAVLDAEIHRGVRLLSMSKIKTVEVNRYNVMELLGVHSRIYEQGEKAKDQEISKTMVEENIQGLMSEIPWLVGTGDETQAKILKTPLAKYEKYAAELRADQMLAIAAGRSVPGIEGIADKKLREPRPDAHGNAQQGS